MADDDKPEPPNAGKKRRWPWVAAGTVVLLFILVVCLLLFAPKRYERTNDAIVSVRYTNVAPQVSGRVATVDVGDNQVVRAGQLLLTIDDRNYCTAVDNAEATYAADRAQTDEARAQVDRQPAILRQAQAQIDAVRAALVVSRPKAERYTSLSGTGAASAEQRQQAVSSLRSDEANLKSAEANLAASRHQLIGLRADHKSIGAKARADKALVDQARLNLGYTHLYAPFDGIVDQRAAEVGDYVTVGGQVMVLVPLNAVYITANYRELALRRMRPGQHARIHVDAYDIWLDGTVQSIAPASGSTYSPIPPNNATGNFTKIVQRLPVKIVVAPNQPLARLLRVGMSVETVVDTGAPDVDTVQRRSDGRVAGTAR